MAAKRRYHRRPAALRGVTASRLWVAEFMIGRGVGIPIGTTFERGHARCMTGLPIRGKTRQSARYGELVSHDDVRRVFLDARAEQVGKDGAAASIIPSEGAWMGGREPSVLARVYWTPQQEKSRRAFQNNMVSLCQKLACDLSQREVLLRLMRPAKQNLLLRCSPTGASKPR